MYGTIYVITMFYVGIYNFNVLFIHYELWVFVRCVYICLHWVFSC